MGYKWTSKTRPYGADTHVIKNESQLEDFLLHHHNAAQFKDGQEPYRIPTGLFIQSVAFITASDVNITGYIWQKYPQDFSEDFVKGRV